MVMVTIMLMMMTAMMRHTSWIGPPRVKGATCGLAGTVPQALGGKTNAGKWWKQELIYQWQATDTVCVLVNGSKYRRHNCGQQNKTHERSTLLEHGQFRICIVYIAFGVLYFAHVVWDLERRAFDVAFSVQLPN